MHKVGETNIANNGQKMTIITYRNNRDVDIQFEDGTIVTSKKFKKDEIRNPNFSSHPRVGETNVANNGQKMTILAYRNADNIDVQFEDGTILTNKKYRCFKKGEIRNPNFSSSSRIGETNTANNGQKMTILAYSSTNNIDIQFEDGTVVTNRDYTSFKRGRIRNPNFNYKIRVGETNTANNGQKMTIIAYRSSKDVDIQFEDGTIVSNRGYSNFKNGNIGNPNFYNKFLGELNTARNGQKMTIVAYRGSQDIDIQFEDGTIVYNKPYYCFKNGDIRNPNFNSKIRVGETNTASNGQKMTIVAYRDSQDIDVQFEDGTILTNKYYASFKKGIIRNPNFYNKFLGELNTARNGQKMTILSYRGAEDIDIQFEDGTIVTNKSYANFRKGCVAHPTISSRYKGSLKDHKLFGLAYRLGNNNVYYYCECTKCDKKDILSPQQILNHKCEE